METSQLIPLSSGIEDQDGRWVQGQGLFFLSVCFTVSFIHSTKILKIIS